MIKVFFNNQEEIICDLISDANKQIQIAVPWFTNRNIFEALKNRAKNGCKIELILLDDDVNFASDGLKFKKLLKYSVEIFTSSIEKPLHSKYLIIDEKKVITGSYNYTYLAENKNIENILLLEVDEMSKSYMSNFEEIKEMSNLLSESDLPLYDKKQSDKLLISPEKIESQKNKDKKEIDKLINSKKEKTDYIIEPVIKDSIVIPKMTLDEIVSKELNFTDEKADPKEEVIKARITTFSLGIKSRIENVDNLLSVIIEKGLEIPCERSSEYYTVMNNQTEMTIITFYGEEKIATNNTRLGSIEIKDLPPLPKGEAKVTVTFKIDKDRNLSVKVLNMSSTSSMEAVYSGNNFTV
jgi:hypothetical protein